MQKVSCGLIGYGAWGAHHARAISEVADAQLTAICARSDASAERARSDYPHATIYRTPGELIADPGIELCSIVLPSHAHFEVASQTLQAGKHVLLEKPMALSLTHCRQLMQIAESQQRVLAVGHELRLSSLWGKVKELVAAGTIGDPLYALIELWRRPYRLGADGWRFDIDRVGNWILEEPIHFFDLARWYFADVGEPLSVFARANGKQPGHPELHDNFSAMVTFAGGRYAVISQTLAGWEHHQTAKLTGTNGAIWAAWSGAMDRTFEPTYTLKVQRGDQIEEVVIEKPSGEVYELVDEVASVVRSVRQSTPPICSGRDGYWSTAMCLQAAESVRTGVPVNIEGLDQERNA
ncbi:MAG: Gfo/Idh/MocA family oxidoreductase [Planctomycetales bacterium]|nr:Gfo/Idh/MocA family oxidoreductase [Planctomycetales bacterium]